MALIFPADHRGVDEGVLYPDRGGKRRDRCGPAPCRSPRRTSILRDSSSRSPNPCRTACMVLMLIAGSTILGHFLAVTKIPMIAADWVRASPQPILIMVLISLIYLIGGSFIDDLAFMVLATPIFYPVILKLGFDPIWFGIMIAITVMIGVVIPPVAINVFVVKNITKVPFGVIYSGVYPFPDRPGGLRRAAVPLSAARHVPAEFADEVEAIFYISKGRDYPAPFLPRGERQ